MEKCYIHKYQNGWGWAWKFFEEVGIDDKENWQCCILSIHFGKDINLGSLLNYRKHGLISLKDYRAIRQLDVRIGQEKHRKQIENLAKYLKIELEIVE